MLSDQIQAIINNGNGIAASVIGVQCNWYRATTPILFIDSTTLQGTINAYFDPKANLDAKVPSTFAHAQWFIAVDRTLLQNGDYLVNPSGDVYFINITQSLTPTGGILCNGSASIYRPGADQSYGPNYYGGNPSGTGTTLIANCPCSILQGTKGESDNSGVLAAGRQPWVAIILPNISGVQLAVDDILIDDQNRRYMLSSIESTQIGMRITAQYAGT